MKNVTKFSFSTKALKGIHSVHRGFLVAGCAAINDINSSMFFILSVRKGKLNEAERAYTTNYICTLFSVQSTKIHEYMKIAKIYRTKILESHPAMGARISKTLNELEMELKSENHRWIEMMRHKVASHLDIGFIDKEIGKLDRNLELGFYASDRKFETAYDFSYEIIYKAIFSQIEGGIEKAATQLLNFVARISEFHNQLVMEIFQQSGLMSKRTSMSVSEENVLPIQSGLLPVLYGEPSSSVE